MTVRAVCLKSTTEHGMRSAAGRSAFSWNSASRRQCQFLGLPLRTSAKRLGSQRSENARLCMLAHWSTLSGEAGKGVSVPASGSEAQSGSEHPCIHAFPHFFHAPPQDAGIDESFQRERSIKRGPKIDSQRKLFLPPKLIFDRQGRRKEILF